MSRKKWPWADTRKCIDCEEGERLQGLPDNWTEGGSNSARYKAIGNGMAQPCADFIMWCVMKILKEK